MKLDKFIENVNHWAEIRGIHEQSTETKQVEKFCEELFEYLTAEHVISELELMDAIGDMAVCLVNAAWFVGDALYITDFKSNNHSIGDVLNYVSGRSYGIAIKTLENVSEIHGYNFEDCLQIAWDEIKDRKGMMVDGLYVKWENLNQDQRAELQEKLDAHIEADC